MSLSVGDALRDGLGRAFERNGRQLIAAFVVIRLAWTVATNTLNRANIAVAERAGVVPGEGAAGPFAGLADAPTPFALGIGVGGAVLLFVGVALVAEAARIVAVRTFFSERTDAIPGEARRNLGTATVNGLVGVVVVLTLTGIGLIALVVPGVFLALAFFFVRQEIAVRDVNFVDAMAGSWELTKGHRLAILGLVVALFVVFLFEYGIGVVVSTASPAAGAVVSAVVRAVVVVFAIASVTRAYEQLRREAEAAAEPADYQRYDGALTAEDLPPPGDAGP